MERPNDKHINEAILVSVDFNPGDEGLLLVARKGPGQTLTVINTMTGENAWDMYQQLLTIKEVDEDE